MIARKIRSLEICVTQDAARVAVRVHPVGPATDKAFRQHQQSARCVRKGQQTRAGEACVRIAVNQTEARGHSIAVVVEAESLVVERMTTAPTIKRRCRMQLAITWRIAPTSAVTAPIAKVGMV